MRIDGTPQWYMTGVARAGGGVRVYASRELSSADVDIDDVNHEQQTRLSAVGRNVLIIDGPDYGWCLNRIQEIWSGNPQPGQGWAPRVQSLRESYPDPPVRTGLPRLPGPGERTRTRLDTSLPLRLEMRMGGLPDGYGGDGYELPPAAPRSRPIPLERAPRPAPGNQPLAIEGPRGDDGDE